MRTILIAPIPALLWAALTLAVILIAVACGRFRLRAAQRDRVAKVLTSLYVAGSVSCLAWISFAIGWAFVTTVAAMAWSEWYLHRPR